MTASVQAWCLCAAWCGVCRDFAPLLAQARHERPDVQLRWLDVEDEAEWLDALDVENFPTLLLAVDGRAVFLGTVTPQLGTLLTLIDHAPTLPALAGETAALLAPVLAHYGAQTADSDIERGHGGLDI